MDRKNFLIEREDKMKKINRGILLILMATALSIFGGCTNKGPMYPKNQFAIPIVPVGIDSEISLAWPLPKLLVLGDRTFQVELGLLVDNGHYKPSTTWRFVMYYLQGGEYVVEEYLATVIDSPVRTINGPEYFVDARIPGKYESHRDKYPALVDHTGTRLVNSKGEIINVGEYWHKIDFAKYKHFFVKLKDVASIAPDLKPIEFAKSTQALEDRQMMYVEKQVKSLESFVKAVRQMEGIVVGQKPDKKKTKEIAEKYPRGVEGLKIVFADDWLDAIYKPLLEIMLNPETQEMIAFAETFGNVFKGNSLDPRFVFEAERRFPVGMSRIKRELYDNWTVNFTVPLLSIEQYILGIFLVKTVNIGFSAVHWQDDFNWPGNLNRPATVGDATRIVIFNEQLYHGNPYGQKPKPTAKGVSYERYQNH